MHGKAKESDPALSLFSSNVRFLMICSQSLPQLTGSLSTTARSEIQILLELLLLSLYASEMAEKRSTLPPDASRQSLGSQPEDEEELVRASKLCETCRPIYDSSLPRPRVSSFDGPFKHHESYTTLCQSAAAGCQLCMILDEKWRRHVASPVYEAPEGALLVCFDLWEGITATSVHIQAHYEDSSKSIGVTLFWGYITNCKTFRNFAFYSHGFAN